ncbi:hypothetical protein [Nocardioides sp. SYSU D00038]|uniref:hypothetical protein n=1 Tax=Nocardioides sp. SYSU D00038 TaxID=2812554 RepID=UPI0019685CF5|nr:hypothetical protein [Nocardioides sp. SYSU D00038]
MRNSALAALAALLVVLAHPAPATSAPPAKNITCDNTASTPLSGTYKNVTVRPGDSCYLLDATVTGNLHARDPHTVRVIDTEVRRNIMVMGATHDVVIGSRGCAYDPVAGNNIMVKKSHNVVVCWMTVKNNIKLSQNDGRISLFRNTVGRNIQVTNNLAYAPQAGDGQHKRINAIRLRHNRAGGHITVSRNAGRPVIAHHNSPAIRG